MKQLDLQKILSIKNAKDFIKEAIEMVSESTRPLLANRSEMKEVYDVYQEYLRTKGITWDTERRKHFLFVIIYIYCPNVLIGDPMPKGFRRELKELLNVGANSVISNHSRDLLFLYRQYRDFREEVDAAYEYISERMGIEDNFDSSKMMVGLSV